MKRYLYQFGSYTENVTEEQKSHMERTFCNGTFTEIEQSVIPVEYTEQQKTKTQKQGSPNE